MKSFRWQDHSLKDLLIAAIPVTILLVVAVIFVFLYWKPAPPNHLTIAIGDKGEFLSLAENYRDILHRNGVRLEIQSSNGPLYNLHLLKDDSANVSVAFVQDGLESSKEDPNIVSLGSLYYEPIWIFYRAKIELTHLSQLRGLKIAIGRNGHGTEILSKRLLKMSGNNLDETKLQNVDGVQAAQALQKGDVDAAFFIRSPEDPLIHQLISDHRLRLMNLVQAEAISRKDAAFHHLVVPRGAIDLDADEPDHDVNILASTATLLVRDDLHPALAYLLLKAASRIHGDPGLFEKRGEFPVNKDDAFPLSDDAVQFYQSGGPFWQRYLPYWLAAWVDRFLLLIPFLALAFPLVKMIPSIYYWRLQSKIFALYEELKLIEIQSKVVDMKTQYQHFIARLDLIEDRVNKIKMPRKFVAQIFSLKGSIQLVRNHLYKLAKN